MTHTPGICPNSVKLEIPLPHEALDALPECFLEQYPALERPARATSHSKATP